MHNTRIELSHSNKLDPFWLGPYRIVQVHGKGYYDVAELNGAIHKERVHGNRLKLYKTRKELENEKAIQYLDYQSIEMKLVDNENESDLSTQSTDSNYSDEAEEVVTLVDKSRRVRKRLRRSAKLLTSTAISI